MKVSDREQQKQRIKSDVVNQRLCHIFRDAEDYREFLAEREKKAQGGLF